jgi:hypothetical protein
MAFFGLSIQRFLVGFLTFLLLSIVASTCFAWSDKVFGGAELYFSGDATQLTQGHQQTVDEAITRIKNADIYFVGITFKRPRDDRWLALGKARAAAVAKHLSELGVSPNLILLEDKPADECDDEEKKYPGYNQHAAVMWVEIGAYYLEHIETAGFNHMLSWLAPSKHDTRGLPLSPWRNTTPLQFLSFMTDDAQRARFLAKLEVAAVYRKDDDLLRSTRAVGGVRDFSNLPPPQDIAEALGTDYAKGVYGPDKTLRMDDKASIAFASKLWCSSHFKAPQKLEMVQRLPVSGLVKKMTAVEQHAFVYCAAGDRSAESLRWLRSIDVDINALNQFGYTPLTHAVRWDGTGISALIAAGADPDKHDGEGLTPLAALRCMRSSHLSSSGIPEYVVQRYRDELMAAGATVEMPPWQTPFEELCR